MSTSLDGHSDVSHVPEAGDWIDVGAAGDGSPRRGMILEILGEGRHLHFRVSPGARAAGPHGLMKMGDDVGVARDADLLLGACEPVVSLACGSPRTSGLLP